MDFHPCEEAYQVLKNGGDGDEIAFVNEVADPVRDPITALDAHGKHTGAFYVMHGAPPM
jgi:hypothetical protein